MIIGTRPAPRTGRWLALACGAPFAWMTSSVVAQPEAPSVFLEKIEVTGSHIARADIESALPVQVITRQELLDGGVQTVQELLDRISANQSFGGFTEALGVGKVVVGFTAASLRGLGSQRTLILLNGRRLAPYALSGGQGVDLSGIPASAIERVEILKDGASAIYGTDAIGGVINFILKKDYQGAEVNANYYATDEGGGNNWRVSGTAGTGDLAKDRYNFFISADYFKQDPLKASQRQSTTSGYIPRLGIDNTARNSFPANILQTDPTTGEVFGFSGIRNPTIPYPGGATPASCAPPYSFPTARRPFDCRFDAARVAETMPESDKAHVIGRFAWQVAPDHQLFAEASYYHGAFTQRVAPLPVDSLSLGGQPATLPITSHYYPTAFVAGLPGGDPTKPVQLFYRPVELGPRTDQAKVDQWNAVLGLNGTLKGWDYQLSVDYTSNREVDSLVSGWVSASKFGSLLRSGVIDPFGPNTEAVLDLMRATQVSGEANDNRASNSGAHLMLSGDVATLPAGPLAAAFGIEGRRERLRQSNSDLLVAGDVAATPAGVPALSSAHRTVWSLFGEVNIPLAKSLETNVAVRYDHYSDFGGTTNPKVTLRWQPDRSVVLRSSWGTGFRAPTLSDLFVLQQLAPDESGLVDPVRCPPPGDDSNPDCATTIQFKVGGNPSLQPETSDQVNAGLVVEPVKGLSASVDYYWVRVRNVIGIVPADVILGPDHAQWSDYIIRNPPDAQHPGQPGSIAYVVQYPTNFGRITTSGIDINLQCQGSQTPVGRFSLALNGTYVLSYNVADIESANAPAGPGKNAAIFGGVIARYRQYAQFNWTFGSWGATLANTFQSGYEESCAKDFNGNSTDPSGCDTRRVGTSSVWDIQGRYAGIKDVTLTLGIRNFMNTPPPVTTTFGNIQVGIDPTYADPRGRIYYGALRYAFQ